MCCSHKGSTEATAMTLCTAAEVLPCSACTLQPVSRLHPCLCRLVIDQTACRGGTAGATDTVFPLGPRNIKMHSQTVPKQLYLFRASDRAKWSHVDFYRHQIMGFLTLLTRRVLLFCVGLPVLRTNIFYFSF